MSTRTIKINDTRLLVENEDRNDGWDLFDIDTGARVRGGLRLIKDIADEVCEPDSSDR